MLMLESVIDIILLFHMILSDALQFFVLFCFVIHVCLVIVQPYKVCVCGFQVLNK